MMTVHYHAINMDARQTMMMKKKSILDVLIHGDIPLPAHCGGSGACGNCRIHLETPPAQPLTASEKRHLTTDEIQSGVRLGCQVEAEKGQRIHIINTPSTMEWQPIDPKALPPPPDMAPGPIPGAGPYGIAIDLGTTHIRCTLWDLEKSLRLAGKSCLNPHTRFGADILQRLDAANHAGTVGRRMKQMLAATVADFIENLRTDGILGNKEIGSVTVVGNTGMLILLTGKNQGLLLNPAHWGREIDVQPENPARLKTAMGISHDAWLHIVPAVAGFVGSDLLAAIVSTGMARDKQPSLLVDFGTNSEIAFWDGNVFWIASAAGGPAFDGCGIRCGMPAAPGAICRIEKGNGRDPFTWKVIGNSHPRGLCGSGIIDAIALLVANGELRPSGMFVRQARGNGFRFCCADAEMILTLGDVDIFQRAKAAIGAGVSAVLHEARADIDTIGRVHVCGAFGRHLNITNAKRIGLLPDLPDDRFIISGNAALAGCERLLATGNWQAAINAIKDRTRLVHLALNPFFADTFPNHLFLRPAGKA